MTISNRLLKTLLLAAVTLPVQTFRDLTVRPYVGFTELEKTQTVQQALDSLSLTTNLPEYVVIDGPNELTHKGREAQQDLWLDSLVKEVAGEMGVDAKKLATNIGFITGSEFGAFEETYSPEEMADHVKTCNITVVRTSLNQLTVKDLKVVLAHEFAHYLQPDNMSPRERERDADLQAAALYGPKAVIETLGHLGKITWLTDEDKAILASKLDTHGTVSERQEAIRKAFPETSLMPVSVDFKKAYHPPIATRFSW